MLKVSLEPSCILVKEWHEVMKLSCIKTLRKNFQVLKSLTFQIYFWLSWFLDDQASYFWISWWIVIFEIEFWPKSQSLTFCVSVDFSSVDQILTINPLFSRNVLNHEIRSTCYVWVFEIMPQSIRTCTRSKVNDQSFSVKTLILTISPLRWFQCFSWGIVINTWSIDEYDFKILILAKNLEVWL